MREIDYGTVGKRIRQIRKMRGWSQDELAKKCGISMSFLGHIERGTRIMSLETFVSICGALDADADELLWGAAHPSDVVMNMWNFSEKTDDRIKEKTSESQISDPYAVYVRIMKSVAEIMNEA